MYQLHPEYAAQEQSASAEPGPGTKDGNGAGDHDTPYSPRTPHALSPFPFTTHQYLRLLLMRSRLRDEALFMRA